MSIAAPITAAFRKLLPQKLLPQKRSAGGIQLKYLVTGTGRNGTVGLAYALSSMGIFCSHERFFRGGSASEAAELVESRRGTNSYCSRHCCLPEWDDCVIAESSYMAAPHLGEPFLACTTVIHAVRSPWKVLSSFLNDIQFFRTATPTHEHELFVYASLPQLGLIDNPIDRAVFYYVHWNLMCEQLGRRRWPTRYIRHRVEDGPELLLRQLGVRNRDLKRLPERTDVNTFKDWKEHMKPPPSERRYEAADIRHSEFWSELAGMAARYGYVDFLGNEPSGSRS